MTIWAAASRRTCGCRQAPLAPPIPSIRSVEDPEPQARQPAHIPSDRAKPSTEGVGRQRQPQDRRKHVTPGVDPPPDSAPCRTTVPIPIHQAHIRVALFGPYTSYFATAASSSSMPRPGAVGTSAYPSRMTIGSTSRSSSRTKFPTISDGRVAAGAAAQAWM